MFTADRAGEVQADMNTLREYSKTQKQAPGCKTPAGCSENGCLGWCDDHRPEARAGVEDLQREVARLKVENARLAEETMRLQRMLNAAHQIVGELARPSGI
jgi:predicted nuclease with TOPRIM domain